MLLNPVRQLPDRAINMPLLTELWFVEDDVVWFLHMGIVPIFILSYMYEIKKACSLLSGFQREGLGRRVCLLRII